MVLPVESVVKQLEDSGIIARKARRIRPAHGSSQGRRRTAAGTVSPKPAHEVSSPELPQGRAKSLILGGYTILDRIGSGGMGQVFKAEHHRMKRLVAIKTLPAKLMKDPAAVARFQREVEAAAKLRHPNIVAADDADEANGVHFLVMEYVDGRDLASLVKKHGPLPIPLAIDYILQAARGLEYAHSEGVIHRDIKPANLLVDKKSIVKILDMGLARIEADREAATQAELTADGTVMGTVDYMAPEQAVSTRNVDARADIYSLGCTLCYLLTGKPTYCGESLMQRMLAHRESPIPSLHALRSEIPEQLDVIFARMVAKRAEDRYQTMSEVVAELEPFASGASTLARMNAGAASAGPSHLSFPSDPTITGRGNAPTKVLQTRLLQSALQSQSKPAVGGSRKSLWISGIAMAAAVLLATIVWELRSTAGTLVVEINQPGASLRVLTLGGTVEAAQFAEKGGLSIAIGAGRYRLQVVKAGFRSFAQDFSITSGDVQTINVALEPLAPTASAKTSSFEQWIKQVANLPPEQQVQAVAKKLQDLNPGFDGKEDHTINSGVVRRFQFVSDHVTNLSPLRTLADLDILDCSGSEAGSSKLADLSPLAGMHLRILVFESTEVATLLPLKEMPLRHLDCSETKVADLSPLAGRNLFRLICRATQVSDLSPLQGMKLAVLNCQSTKIRDLSPLRGMPLTDLRCAGCNVSDLTPLKGMRLQAFGCDLTPVSDLTPLHGMPLEKLWIVAPRVKDLSPLEGMKLKVLYFSPRRITRRPRRSAQHDDTARNRHLTKIGLVARRILEEIRRR